MKSTVTILDVAARAGVSISSVSAALNGRPGVSEQTRARIIEVAQQLGWVPSLRGRSLSGRKAYAVGLALERPSAVIESDPFFAGFIAGVESVLEQHGFALVLQVASSRRSAVQRYEQMALDHRVDGVFLTDLARDDARVRLVTELGLPAVAVNSSPRCSLPSVRQDHRPGLVELMDEVVSSGHKRIAHVAGRRGFIHTRQRVEVWRSALANAGLGARPARVRRLLDREWQQGGRRDARDAGGGAHRRGVRQRPHGDRLHRPGERTGDRRAPGDVRHGFRRHTAGCLRAAGAHVGQHRAAPPRWGRGHDAVGGDRG